MTNRELAVRKLFARIAPYYGLLNTILSLGLHKSWRRKAMVMLALKPGERCLDVCSGTGDLALAVQARGGKVIALDMTAEMLQVAQKRAGGTLDVVMGDALCLPFADDSFDCVTLGFGLRHSEGDLPTLLTELARVVKPGGRLMSLELSHPPNRSWRMLSNLYIHMLLPVIGGLYDREAYHYLSQSIEEFPNAADLAEVLVEAGFAHCDYKLLSGGIAAVHLATV